MKLLFVADPLSTFQIQKDSTFTMMREAQARGHEVWSCDTSDLHWQTGRPVSAQMHQVHLTGDHAAWYTIQQTHVQPLHSMGAVLMPLILPSLSRNKLSAKGTSGSSLKP